MIMKLGSVFVTALAALGVTLTLATPVELGFEKVRFKPDTVDEKSN